MLKRFSEIQVDNDGAVIDKANTLNYNIFKNNHRLIDQELFRQYFATYPVIHVNFKDTSGCSFDEILDNFKRVLHELFQQYSYLLRSKKLKQVMKRRFNRYYYDDVYEDLTEKDVVAGLEFLSKCLYKHFHKNKVFILIDEYDAAVNSSKCDSDIISDINRLMDEIYSATLQGNSFIERALLIGVSGMSYSIYFGPSGFLYDVKKCMFLTDHRFRPLYGLKLSKVDSLLNDVEIDSKESTDKLDIYDEIRLSNTKLFCLWSILNDLEEFDLKNPLRFPVINYSIEDLLSKNKLVIRIFTEHDLLYILSLRLRYLEDFAMMEYEGAHLFMSFVKQEGYGVYEKVVDLLKSRYLVNISDFAMDGLNQAYQNEMNAALEDYTCIHQGIDLISEERIFEEFINRFGYILSRIEVGLVAKDWNAIDCLRLNGLLKTETPSGLNMNAATPNLIYYEEDIGTIVELKYPIHFQLLIIQILNIYLQYVRNEAYFKNLNPKLYIGLNSNHHFAITIGKINRHVDVARIKFFSTL